MYTKKQYDVIVVGAGHAGVEAAYASARMGCSVLLLTMNLDSIGAMSCNPAIGGIGKGQLVKEVDALGGLMAKAADACGIQFRILNSSKGHAVRSTRSQEDMFLYKNFIKSTIEKIDGLEVRQAEVIKILADNSCVVGVRISTGEEFNSKTVVLTPGTFLNGVMHIGLVNFSGGRLGEKASDELSLNLKELGLPVTRFKTGTCPRVDGRSINFKNLNRHDGDSPIQPFSFSTKSIPLAQLPCHMTYTNEKTHDIIRSGLDRSPLYSGKIKATGVRYCPSIEDKVVRFSERTRHQIFLEPQGLDTVEIYPNGISTSLPVDVQLNMLHSIEGLENARIMRPGYGIEYDRVDSTALYSHLETKQYQNLFLAGQINGTTGYEEAAAQGLMAGVNAALRSQNKAPFVLGRNEAYIGVLIDDLVTKGTDEPYRMFTSRVEYRLILREDNADLRLREYGHRLGLVSDKDLLELENKKEKINAGLKYLKETRLKPAEVNETLESLGSSLTKGEISLEDLLKRPQISFNNLLGLNHISENLGILAQDVTTQIEIEIKYCGFIQRQKEQVERFKKIERIKFPKELDFKSVRGLSKEIVEKLDKFKPVSLGQAARISGVTPAAVSILMVYITKLQRRGYDENKI